MVGWTDAPADLSDRPALGRLAAHLPTEAVLVSSDLQRAVATADAVQGARLRLPHDPALREIHFGQWESRLFADAATEAPEHARAFLETPGDIRAPGGESWHDLEARAHPAVDRLIAAHKGGSVVVVAHFVVILSLLRRARDVTPAQVLAQKIDNLSVTDLTCVRGRWSVGAVNLQP